MLGKQFLNAGLSFGLLATTAMAQQGSDHVFIISGGGAPSGNHYSQYLQTKLLTEGMRGITSPDLVQVRFGAGNNGVTPATLHDVHRVVKKDGLDYQVLLPGHIAGNAPATKNTIISYFKDAAAKTIKADDSFFLFVTDHGNPYQGDFSFTNNCISLWTFSPESTRSLPFDQSCLSVKDLRGLLQENVKAKQTVFAMTQCFSGGFHQMSVQRQGKYPTANTSLCGFTAVTSDTTASGCTADVDGPGYKGYERYLAQQLTGKDVVTGAAMPYARKTSLRAAHMAAALEDTAKDIPFTTSDYYLTEWANVIASRGFQPRSQTLSAAEAVKLYRAALNADVGDETLAQKAGVLKDAVTARQAYLNGTVALLGNYDAELAGLGEKSSAELKGILNNFSDAQQQLQGEANNLSSQAGETLYRLTVQPWSAAVKDGKVAGLSPLEKDTFELDFISHYETAGYDYVSPAILQLSVLAPLNQNMADALSSYIARRDALRLEWLKAHLPASDVKEILAAKALEEQASKKWEEASKMLERYDQVRRVLFTRMQIAAAVVLGASEDQTAIAELTGLEQCEAIPFRASH